LFGVQVERLFVVRLFDPGRTSLCNGVI